jgi:hypothetical protein
MLVSWKIGDLPLRYRIVNWETKVLNRQIVGTFFSNKPKWRYTWDLMGRMVGLNNLFNRF